MKKFVLVFWLSAFAFLYSYGQSGSETGLSLEKSSHVSESKETEAIMKVIDAETSYFFFRDYEGWKKQWIQADYVFHAWNFADGSYGASVGWAAVDEKIGNYIKSNPVDGGGSSHPEVKRENIKVRFFGPDVAHLVWEQYNSTRDLSAYNVSHEVRTMEKMKGEWKIVQVSAFWDFLNTIPSEHVER
jgi:hypothetical protein